MARAFRQVAGLFPIVLPTVMNGRLAHPAEKSGARSPTPPDRRPADEEQPRAGRAAPIGERLIAGHLHRRAARLSISVSRPMSSSMCRVAILLAASLLAASAGAQSSPGKSAYIDNRSTATDVIRSLYSAIDRGEYLRAWSYFHEPDRPDFKSFTEGYADTVSVRLATGDERSEGAAGTVYWAVPVAIEAVHTDGTTTVFAGCYTLSQPNSHLQAVPPFQPIGIRDGTLHSADGPLHEAVPNDCGKD